MRRTQFAVAGIALAATCSGQFLATRSASAAQGGVIRVTVDVKPGDEPTTLEPKREGMVPVAILSSKNFDAVRVDVATVRAGATGSEASLFRSMTEDVNNDRVVDLLLLLRVPQLGLSCSSKSVIVKGKTEKGQDFEGSEAVTMVGC